MLLLFKEYTILSGENVIVFPNSDKYFHNFGDFSTSKQTTLACKNLFFKRFFCPQDMIGLLRSNLGIFSIAKV